MLSWRWNGVLGVLAVPSWPWNGVLDGLTAPSWPWNDVLVAPAVPSWPWNGVSVAPAAPSWPWNDVLDEKSLSELSSTRRPDDKLLNRFEEKSKFAGFGTIFDVLR